MKNEMMNNFFKFAKTFISSVLPLATLLAIVGCGPSGNSFRLKGSIKGMESGEIYIYNTSADNARFDTLRIENGNFFYGGNAEQPTPYILVYPNALEQVIFIGPGDEIEYEATSNDLNNYKADGSKENKLMNTFRSDIQNVSYSDTQLKARKFITENTQSAVSLYIFDRYFVQNAQTSYKELTEILEILRPANEENIYFMTLAGKVKEMQSINVGDEIPDCKMKGKNSSSSLWKGSAPHTIVLCWATWLPGSYEFMTKIRQASRDYSKDKMRIVAFSIDAEYDRWSNMTQFDSVSTIEHYVDTRAFDSPSLKKLKVRSLPTYFIYDSKHKVVAKGMDANQMSKDIQKYAE